MEYTFDQLVEAFPEVPAIEVLRWVFNQPSLRKPLLSEARDLILRHEYAQLGNRARNKKLTAAEKSILARHAALCRHRKSRVTVDRSQELSTRQVSLDFLFSNAAVNGAGAGY
jgi:hypothetical protein